MKAINYRIKLMEPALLTGIEGDPNDAVSLNYLPGSVLRGAVMSKYRRQYGDLEAADGQIRRLFLDGSTRFLNGYLVSTADNPAIRRRGLPLPLSLQCGKGTKEPLYDFSIEKPAGGPWQAAGDPFGILAEDNQDQPVIYPLLPKRQLKVHNQRLDRTAGRPTEEAGAVYRYESLATGQNFEAVILCDTDADATLLMSLLPGEILLGGARSGGYGQAFIQEKDIQEQTEWREAGGKPIEDSINGSLTVTLLSDALVRDSRGQFVASAQAVKIALEKRLGLAPKTLVCDCQRSFWRGQLSGGFNRQWGLPLPQALAVKMGSVFVLKMPERCTLTANQLNSLEAQGIGERRAEGFGRVAVNWHIEYEKWNLSKPNLTPPSAVSITGRPEQELARQMVKRMLRQRLDEYLISRIIKITVQQAPSRSQLARLRNVIRTALLGKAPDLERLEDFLQQIEKRQSARSQFECARVEGRSLLKWIKEVLGQTRLIEWRRLLELQDLTLPCIGDIQADLNNEDLRKEYLLRLVDGVLARARKNRDLGGMQR